MDQYAESKASPEDTQKAIDSLASIPKSEFYVANGGIRGQTDAEKRVTDEYMARKTENELVKTVKAPFR